MVYYDKATRGLAITAGGARFKSEEPLIFHLQSISFLLFSSLVFFPLLNAIVAVILRMNQSHFAQFAASLSSMKS
jgi:hypothetical protein